MPPRQSADPVASPTMARRTRLAKTATAAPTRTVRSVTPDPLLWREAVRVADGDLSRIRVISETEAVVR